MENNRNDQTQATPLYRVDRALSPPRADSVYLDSYLVHIRTQTCAHCHAVHTSSEVYEVWIANHSAARTAARTLKPAVSPLKPISIGVTRLQDRPTPVCHACVSALADPTMPTPEREAQEAAWAAALRAKARQRLEAEASTPSSTPTAKVTPTLDQL